MCIILLHEEYINERLIKPKHSYVCYVCVLRELSRAFNIRLTLQNCCIHLLSVLCSADYTNYPAQEIGKFAHDRTPLRNDYKYCLQTAVRLPHMKVIKKKYMYRCNLI